MQFYRNAFFGVPDRVFGIGHINNKILFVLGLCPMSSFTSLSLHFSEAFIAFHPTEKNVVSFYQRSSTLLALQARTVEVSMCKIVL